MPVTILDSPAPPPAVVSDYPADDEPLVPDGWHLLPAGPVRQLRVNRLWVEGRSDYPFILLDGGLPELHSEVRILGASQLRCGLAEAHGCRRSAWVETTAALLVR